MFPKIAISAIAVIAILVLLITGCREDDVAGIPVPDAQEIEAITLVSSEERGYGKTITLSEDIQAVCTTFTEATAVLHDESATQEIIIGYHSLMFYFHLRSGETAALAYSYDSYTGQVYYNGYTYDVDTTEFLDFWTLDYEERKWNYQEERFEDSRIPVLDTQALKTITLVNNSTGYGKTIHRQEDISAICTLFNDASMALNEEVPIDDYINDPSGFLFRLNLRSGETIQIIYSDDGRLHYEDYTYDVDSTEFPNIWELDYEEKIWNFADERFENPGD